MKEPKAIRYYVSRFMLLWLGISLFLFCGRAFGAIPASERAALIAFYKSTKGDGWKVKSGWKTPPLAPDGFALPGKENTWYGITCDPTNTYVKEIGFRHNNLRGVLPPEIGDLTRLMTFKLTSTQLTGSIPPEMGKLGNLQSLEFTVCDALTGRLPPELGNLVNLKTLEIFSCNQLTGRIPPELGDLVNLESFKIYDSKITGRIPPELGELNNLEKLSLLECKLTGSIPPALGNLHNLQTLEIINNDISGSIPPQLGRLSKLRTLNLGGNNLNGSIPEELGYLTGLKYLNLPMNSLTGKIPPVLGNLEELYAINLSHNNLKGRIPPELGNLGNLHHLFLADNKLTGRIPAALGNLTKVIKLYLHSNNLSGPIPASLQNLENLGYAGTIYYYGISLCWNALYTDNSALQEFITNHHDDLCDWRITQTVPPEYITASFYSKNSMELYWKPINYQLGPGSYRVFYSTSANGPFKFAGRTIDKYSSSLKVTGLKPGTTYYFKVQTQTSPNVYNRNTVHSKFSRVVSTDDSPIEVNFISISGMVRYKDRGLPGVTLTISNNGGTVVTDEQGCYIVILESGWQGIIRPVKEYFRFNPYHRYYLKEMSSGKSNQDFSAILPLTINIMAERKKYGSFFFSLDYGAISLWINNETGIPVSRYVIERKEKGGAYRVIHEFTDSKLTDNMYGYEDRFLDKIKSYTYRLIAYDSQGNELASSIEFSI